MITVAIRGQSGEEVLRQVEPGTTFEAIAADYQEEYNGTIAVAAG